MRVLPRGPFRLTSAVVGLLLGLSLAGCGSSQPEAVPFPDFTPRATVAVATPDAGGVQQVSLRAVNSRFVPQTIQAHAGQLDITVTNEDDDIHEITVFTTATESATGATDAVSSDTIKPAATGRVLVTLDKPGTYKFFCKFHRDEGMFGEITVK
ncbi:MAG TPA: cupredoxin domain-containing protein [Mycobacteriales bacterium]